MKPTRLCVAIAAAAALVLAGCGPKLVRSRVFENDQVRVEVRHFEKSGTVLAHGWSQPATISEVRIAHILANLAFEDSDQKQRLVIRTEHVYDLAGGIAKALAKATPDDEIAAAAFPTDRRFAIFSDQKVTAFRLHVDGDELKLEFISVEEPLEKEGVKVGYKEWEIPADLPTFEPHFTLVPGQATTRFGPRGVSVAWRDDAFRRPVNLHEREAGKKRTVLMELPDEPHDKAKPDDKKAGLPEGLSDAQLQAMDQLEASRTSGSITEGEYQKRRRLILENRLGEAGYGAKP
ncbi:MAG TPA: hypothetical protein VMR31_02575 [Myxococcota bacterium]|nr:hypothetical protein [Myxococcota bacterium]